MATVMPIVVVLYNVIAVIILTLFAPLDKKPTRAQLVKRIGKSVLLNPLIIGIVLGLAFLSLPFALPAAIRTPISYLDALTMPLSLICLGASFRFSHLKGRVGLALIATALRICIFPVIAVATAILLGFREESLGVIFIIFGSSSAVASFVMAKQMGSDSELAGQTVLLTTLFSSVTIFIGTTLLKFFALI